MKKSDALKVEISRVNKIIIEHSIFNEALVSIDQCYQMAEESGDSICVAIVGESGAGKSRTLEAYETLHARVRHMEFCEIPVLRVKVNANPTIKGLAEKILLSLGDPLFNKGTENEKTARVQRLICAAKTRVLILDEFQHFADQGGRHIQHHVADWLKVLVDDMRIGLVIAGLERSVTIIKSNEQLARRFNAPIVMKSFEWEKTQERLEFLAFLAAMQRRSLPFEFPKLDSEEMGLRIYCATRGLIGNIVKLLSGAAYSAVKQNDPRITLVHLANAYKKTIWGPGKQYENPFTSHFLEQRSLIKSPSLSEKTKLISNDKPCYVLPDSAAEVLRAR